jgi:hypothetical protein
VICPNATVALSELNKADYVRDATIFGQSIHLLMDADAPSDVITETLARIGITGPQINLARASLEDVFVSLTRRYARAS